MMRFLVVLALLKCAAPSVIDPANHKTVSVPIGNGMNVDVDVTVDIDTAVAPGIVDNGGCIEDGKPCKRSSCTRKCCSHQSFCVWTNEPCECGHGKKQCTKLYENCETNSECCDEDAECRWHGVDDDDPYGNRPLTLEQVCLPKDKGPERPECAKLYDTCSSAARNSKCCDEDAECRSQEVSGDRPNQRPLLMRDVCLPKETKQCSKLKHGCDTASDCCDEEAECKPIGGPTWMGLACSLPERVDPPQCIPDGEPCHGTDDWEHECCSDSCCEGKCGKCLIIKNIWN